MNTELLWDDERIAFDVGILSIHLDPPPSYEATQAINELMREMRDDYRAYITALEQAAPVSAWEVIEGYDDMVNNAPGYLSRSQCRMLAEEGWQLMRPATTAGEEVT